jgi:hypothetical protein
MTYTESVAGCSPWGAIESLVAVEDYRGQRLLPRQSVQLPGFEVPVGAEDEVEGVLALVGVPVPRPACTSGSSPLQAILGLLRYSLRADQVTCTKVHD